MGITEKNTGCEITTSGIILVKKKVITSIERPLKKLNEEANDGYTKSNGLWIPERKILLPNY